MDSREAWEEKYVQLFRSLGLGCLGVFVPLSAQISCLCVDLLSWNTDVVFSFSRVLQRGLHLGKWGHAGLHVSLVAQSTRLQSCECLLRGEVLKPATELAMKKSAICLRARRPVGLFPFLCCSWIRLSNSCLKAWKRRVEQWDNVIHIYKKNQQQGISFLDFYILSKDRHRIYFL